MTPNIGSPARHDSPPPLEDPARHPDRGLLGAPAGAVGDAVLEVTPILEALGRRPRPAPITAATAADLASLIGRNTAKNAK